MKHVLHTITPTCTPVRTLNRALVVYAMVVSASAFFGSRAQAESVQTDAINPLTGHSLSSEALARELARVKLEAELSETRAKLAKSQGDLALATIRQSLEEKRLTAEIKTGAISGSSASALSTQPRLIELPRALPSSASSKPSGKGDSTQGQSTAGTLALRVPSPSALDAAAPASAAQPPGGHLQIGSERISVSDLHNARVNTVESADGQKRAPQQLFGQASPSRQLGMPNLTPSASFVPPIGGSAEQGAAPAAPASAMPAFSLE